MCFWLEKQIKAQDYFAEKVSLTQNGNKEFRSMCGGIVSILTCVLVVIYGLLNA